VWIALDGARVQVRVHGIDAPERAQPFGREAADFASRTLLNKRVAIARRGVDRHDRVVAAIAVDGRDFAELLVGQGYAWHDTRFAPRDLHLAMAERAARDARRGLWAASSPQAPWDFRRAAPPESSRAPVAFKGNRGSRVFHAPGCLDYDCANCTVALESIDDARARGFRPHAACVR
jgi:endonuclease YncB( thermonuclease family)